MLTVHTVAVAGRPVARGGQGGHDPPMKLTVACAAGHFAPSRSATKRKVVHTLAQCTPSFDLTISNHILVF